MIDKVVLKNFRRFQDATFDFQRGLNVLVGDNEAGKSTLLEAINLALTKRWSGQYFERELSHHFITRTTVETFVVDVQAGKKPFPPELIVEVYFADEAGLADIKGSNNSLKENAPGYRLSAKLDPDFDEEYKAFLSQPHQVTTVPIEFYRVEWTKFSGGPVNVRAPKVRASLIDASRIRLKSGADYHLQRIIGETLDPKQRALLARSYRLHQEEFGSDPSIQAVSTAVAAAGSGVTNRDFTLEIDTSGANGWESALAPHLDQLPFHFTGSGEQSRLKILLALARRVEESHVILVEEPENHLSFPNLHDLVEKIVANSADRQIIVATHSSFVVNKLGLGQLMLLSSGRAPRLTDLPEGTQDYFKKLAGYDTLRLVLAQKVVLVEGPSDELIVQRAYFDRHDRRTIEDGIDVIAVRGLSAKRFLDLAIPLERQVVVVSDNDGNHAQTVDDRFSAYTTAHKFIHVARSDDDTLNTLEPQLLAANGLELTNRILGKEYPDDEVLLKYMRDHKTDVAIAFHDTTETVTWPPYIEEAIDALG